MKTTIRDLFKIGNRDMVIVTQKYFCTGHWAILRTHLKTVGGPQSYRLLDNLKNLIPGRYQNGPKGTREDFNEKGVDDLFATKTEGYAALSREPTGIVPCPLNIVSRFTFDGVEGEKVYVAPSYLSVMDLGRPFYKRGADRAPILICGEKGLEDVVAVLMPMLPPGQVRS